MKQQQPHKLIHMINEDPDYADDSERIRDMVIYIVGGFDTTSNAIAFALLELSRHPEEQTKLRKELQNYESDEEARHCPALKFVVKETLRCGCTHQRLELYGCVLVITSLTIEIAMVVMVMPRPKHWFPKDMFV